MIKYTDTQVVFREFPDEVTLAINLSLCPNHCDGCHSPYLRENIGDELNNDSLNMLIKNNCGITCIGFMGGDNDTETLLNLIKHIKDRTSLKCGWYSGKDVFDKKIFDSKLCDYIKIGHYDSIAGPLDKETTNQQLFHLKDGEYENITHLFWKK